VDERVLGVVGVLVLVDEDVAEASAVGVGDVRERTEEVDGLPMRSSKSKAFARCSERW
jgi:hypothetical protein